MGHSPEERIDALVPQRANPIRILRILGWFSFAV
jgi:hypothetical protein